MDRLDKDGKRGESETGIGKGMSEEGKDGEIEHLAPL